MLKTVTDITNKIPENLKNLREDADLTQLQLCKKLEKYGCFMHRSTYAKYETGQRQASLEALVAISQFFGVSIDYLFYGNN